MQTPRTKALSRQPSSMLAPTTKAVAMPSWLALRQIAVESERSLLPNHVADNSGGAHWKKGWAIPMRMVPIISQLYSGRLQSKLL
jgi:hypothetical protein